MLRNLATSFFEEEKIVTTVHKAKALKPILDKLVNLAKKGDLNSYRRGLTLVTKRKTLKGLFNKAREDDLGAGRDSGYVSMARTKLRAGDAATLVQLSLIGKSYTKAATGVDKIKTVDRGRRVAASKAKSEAKPKGSKLEQSLSKAIDAAKEKSTPPKDTDGGTEG
jgi:large subunit ribosomal protein L17